MADKTFILGVGAQKSGTTWLHDYLSRAGNAQFGRCKEYHVWDALHLPELARFRVTSAPKDPDSLERLRWSMQKDPELYFDYFHGLLGPRGIDLTGDITPSYCALDRQVMRRIIRSFADRSVDCKAIYLMRDPVARCISAFELHLRIGAVERCDDDAFVADATGRNAMLRTGYERTLAELEASFEPEKLFLALYEELFTPHSIMRLSAFASVRVDLDHGNAKVNPSRLKVDINRDAQAAVAMHYRDVYDFMARRFPQSVALWNGYRLL